MEGLNFDNILGENEIDTLFEDTEETAASEEAVSTSEKEKDSDGAEEKETETKETTEDVDPEELFAEEEDPESVGSGKTEEKGTGDAATDEGSDTSPDNFYSSIANALAVDGIFPNLDDETIRQADSAEGLSNLIEAEVHARLDEQQQRVAKALENGVEASDIRKYEGTIQYLSGITDAQVAEESKKGEELRENLIYQDFLNKGYSPEKARKLTSRTVEAGTDVEDAKEALQGNIEFFQMQYNKLLKEAQDAADKEKADRQKQAEKLKTSIMKDAQLLGDIELSADMRRKVYDNITKPVYKDSESGDYLTALQKYEAENRADFIKYVGLLFTLTNGFKDFDSFTKGKVRKEVNKGLKGLEQRLNNTRRSSDGSLDMGSIGKRDPESYFNKGYKLDL